MLSGCIFWSYFWTPNVWQYLSWFWRIWAYYSPLSQVFCKSNCMGLFAPPLCSLSSCSLISSPRTSQYVPSGHLSVSRYGSHLLCGNCLKSLYTCMFYMAWFMWFAGPWPCPPVAPSAAPCRAFTTSALTGSKICSFTWCCCISSFCLLADRSCCYNRSSLSSSTAELFDWPLNCWLLIIIAFINNWWFYVFLTLYILLYIEVHKGKHNLPKAKKAQGRRSWYETLALLGAKYDEIDDNFWWVLAKRLSSTRIER